MNAILALANPNLGQTLLTPLLADDTLPRLSRGVDSPFYKAPLGLRRRRAGKRSG